jgi:hypothetical protein
MHLFHRIDDAQCIVRQKGGVFRQAELYRRKDRIYVKHGGGFLRVLAPFDQTYGTTSPSVNVIDMPAGVPGLACEGKTEPRWTKSY